MTDGKNSPKVTIRSVIAEAVANSLDACRDEHGVVDKDCLRGRVELAVARHPSIDRAITVQLRRRFMERAINECLRGTRDAFPKPATSAAPAALWDQQDLRAVVQVPRPNGKFDAKDRLDLDMPEVDAMAHYYDRLGQTAFRDRDWYRAVKARWVQLGLPETATVRQVLGL